MIQQNQNINNQYINPNQQYNLPYKQNLQINDNQMGYSSSGQNTGQYEVSFQKSQQSPYYNNKNNYGLNTNQEYPNEGYSMNPQRNIYPNEGYSMNPQQNIYPNVGYSMNPQQNIYPNEGYSMNPQQNIYLQ